MLAPGEQSVLPSGTVTFLFTDIEASSSHWESSPVDMRAALAVHDEIVATAVKRNDGAIVKHMGDGCWAAFASAPKAAAAAVDFQRDHQKAVDDLDLRLRVRLGLHTGDIEPTERDYFGPVVNRAARIVDLANGDQIICSSSTAGLLNRHRLRDEGLHELRGIGTEEIFVLLDDSIVTDDQPLRRPVAPTNLPKINTSFLGRADDIAMTVGYIEQGKQLITLVGPGGVGKTRLAVEVGGGASAAFNEHVYFCDLVPIADGDADAVVEAVAEVVGARRQPDMTLLDSVVDHLSGRRSLLIVDNCEHVIGTVRTLAARLVEVDDMHVVATSREALGLAEEQQVIVAPLATSSGAIELFVDRARHRDPSFVLTEDTEEAVRDIVERLEGIPLAIELAAARIRLMTPAELAERLEDGFRVLGTIGSDRHETLRETVRWSYDLLGPAEATLFTRLCVFAGGFTLDAVEEVCADGDLLGAADIPDLLLALVDKSMVVSTITRGHRRFTMLETLRAFAADELETADGTADHARQHAAHFAQVARRQGDRFWTAAEPDAWRVLDAEWSNLRIAVDTSLAAGALDVAAELAIAVFQFGCIAMRYEVFSWAESILDTPGIEEEPTYSSICGSAALGAYFTVHGDGAALAETGLAADPTDPESLCRMALAAIAMNNDQNAQTADEVTAAWLATERETVGGRIWAECFRIFYLSTYAYGPEADERAATAARLAAESGSVTARALTCWARGQALSYQDMDQAMAVWQEGLEAARSLPGEHLVEHLLDGLILHLTVAAGELAESLAGCRQAVQGGLDRHYHAGTSHLFGVTAIALARAGDAPTGARLVGAMTAKGHQARSNARRALQTALGDDLDAHLASGAGLSITEAGRLAIDALDLAIERLQEQPT